MQCYQQGQLDRAAHIYQQILAAAPGNPTALHLLGVIAYQKGDAAQAVQILEQAVAAEPDSQRINHLGAALFAANRLEEAIQRYRQAIQANPNYADSYSNLGVALQKKGELAEAEQVYRQALQINPQYGEACNNLGIVLRLQGRLDEAARLYAQAIGMRPNYADPITNLAGIKNELGQYEEAITLYRRALQIVPNKASVHNSLGLSLKRIGHIDEAVASYNQALALDPKLAEARSNLVAVLADREQFSAATELLNEGTRLDGDPLWEIRKVSFCRTIFDSQADIDEHRAGMRTFIEKLKERPFTLDLAEQIPPALQPPFNWQFHGRNDRELRQAYAELFVPALPKYEPTVGSGRPRIGFFVSKWHERAFLKSARDMLEAIDPESLDLAVICAQATAPNVQSQLRKNHVRVVPVPERMDHLAETILAEQFDVIYHWEIGTDSTNYIVPFLRLAPVQCTSWGIQETSGVPNIDYYITSKLAEPPGAEDHYSERPVLLETEVTFQRRLELPAEVKQRSHYGFSDADHLYSCIQQLGKFHPDFDQPLGEILRRDPQGKVLLCLGRLPEVAVSLQARLQKNLPDVYDRIVFLPRLPQAEYLSVLNFCDVVLDTFHFAGGFTTFDALSFNKPIVTWPGEFRRGRFTSACYRQMNYERCIADTFEDWVQLVVALGTDQSLRQQVTRELAEATGELFENRKVIAENERIFHELSALARQK